MTSAGTGRTAVVIASRLFVPEVSAGAFRLGALARGLTDAAASVTVVTTVPPQHAPATPDPAGVSVSRWPVLRDSGGNVRGYLQYASFDVPLLLRLIFRRWSLAVAESPPTTGLVVAMAAAVRRRPFAYYAADVWTDGVKSMGASSAVVEVMRRMERAVLRRAAVTLSISDEVTDRLVALGADRERVVVVGNGIDTDVFAPGVAPAADERYFVYTGTMSEWQRPEIFVRAFAAIAQEHPDVRLRFFGQGAVERDLRSLAEQLVPGRVVFGGVVSPAESASWIRGATAALVSIAPGIGYDFARPTKTYAAAACGTPVLFTGARSGRELVADAELGEAVEFETDAVADAMRRLLDAEASGETERRRPERAAWALAHVSLAAVGQRAAEAVLSALSRRP
ncbi:glycosyltransferase family 4 protein [Microbacterium sulfonylureivorans]|uniref:glycosyltransferase family 4 protein n=1 Tax=Microbacterium sulfonylureivorans TaxID=2486854 RepID=UPI000FDB3E76|nr:glycosyltransferase family 4 protein [Microbacterium sulfonylureivorans]